MRKNKLIALIGTLTMAAAGLAAVSAGVSSKKADSVSAVDYSNTIRVYFDTPSWESISTPQGNVGNSGWKAFSSTAGLDTGSTYGAYYLDGTSSTNLSKVNAYFVQYGNNYWHPWNGSKDTNNSDINGTFKPGYYYQITNVNFNCDEGWEHKWFNYTVNEIGKLPVQETYTVAFDKNNGSGAMSSISTNVGTATTLPSCLFTAPSGFFFKEWNTQADGQGTSKQPGETIGNTQAKDTTLTMYAIWEEYNPSNGYWIEFFNSGRDPQRVKLAHNGESGSSSQWSASDVHLNVDDTFKIVRYESGSIPSQNDYWGTKYALSEDGKAIHDGQLVGASVSEDPDFKVNYDGNYTFYFHDYYNLNKLDVPSIIYEVTYDVNGGTKSGDTYVIHPKVGKELTTATPETAGYSAPTEKQFLEWNTAADGSGNGFGVNSIVAGSENYAQGDEVTLYAIWGDSSVSNGTYLRGSWGWNASSQKTMNTNPDNVSEQMITGIALNPNEKVKVITYTDGAGTYRDAITTSIDSESGYTQPTIDGNGDAVVSERGVFKIYVNTSTWNYHFYPLRLNYNGNGGSGSMDPSYPTGEGYLATISANEFTAPTGNFRFAGWNTQADGKGTSYAAGATIDFSSATDNITLYAQWEDSTVYRTITFSTVEDEEDRGTIDATSVIVPDGTTFKVADNKIKFDDDKNTIVTASASEPDERYSYSFFEWTYYSGKLPDEGTIENDFTIYAKFDAQDVLYTITLDYDDGKGGSSSINNLKLDDELTVVSVPRYVGYTFNGYFTGKNGTGIKYYDKDGKPVHQKFDDPTVSTLYASWTHNLCTVTFVLPDGHPGTAPESIDLYYGDPYSLSAPEAWAGHDFDAWYTGPNGTGNKVSNTGTYPFEDDLTLYANFTLNDYAISFEKDGGTGGSLSLTSYNISNVAQTFTITDPELSENHPSYSIEVSDTFAGTAPSIDDHTVTIPAGSYGDFTVVTTWIPNDPQVTITIVGDSYGSVTVDGEPYSGSFTVPYNSDYMVVDDSILIDEIEIVATANESVEPYTYSFDGFTGIGEEGNVTEDTEIIVTFSCDETKYEIMWLNYDEETVLETDKDVTYGSTPTYNGETPEKPSTAQYDYEFSGWSPEIHSVVGDEVYVAQFTEKLRAYTIKFVNDDGTELQSSEVNYGVMPSYNGETPTKAGDAQFSYTFAGWDKTIVEVNGEATYTATYSQSVNKYTVTWKNYDGTVIETDTNVPYGTKPSFDGTEPTKPQTESKVYTFNGWDTDLNQGITGNTVITAEYKEEARKYAITWLQDDGTPLRVDQVPYGTVPSYGSDPTKEATEDYTYTFAGWNVSPVEVSGDATYTATYNATKTPSKEAKDYATKFLEEMDKVCILETDSEGNIQVKTVVEDLAGAWSSMATDYAKLSKDAQDLLTGATPVYDETSEDIVGKFASSYDYIWGKYHVAGSLDDFADRNPTDLSGSRNLISINNVSTSTWIIATVAVVGIAAVGVFFIYRKRKEN